MAAVSLAFVLFVSARDAVSVTFGCIVKIAANLGFSAHCFVTLVNMAFEPSWALLEVNALNFQCSAITACIAAYIPVILISLLLTATATKSFVLAAVLMTIDVAWVIVAVVFGGLVRPATAFACTVFGRKFSVTPSFPATNPDPEPKV